MLSEITRTKTPDTLLSVGDVASLLRCCDQTVREYIRSGVLPARKIGQRWRFDADAVKAFIQQSRKGM